MSKLIKTTLGEIAAPGRSVISGPFGSSIGQRFFQKSGIPVIRGNNLTTDSKMFVDNGFVYLTEEKADELKADAIEGDIIFTAAGTIGQVGMIPTSATHPRYVISNKQMRFRPDPQKADPLFVYYWLASPWIFKTIVDRNTGSTVPLINLGIIKGLPIFLSEEVSEQKKIAKVIASIDKKIELNNRINTELEAMAKTLYDYWFVQFDFPFDFDTGKPDPNGKPYKSSGGKMVYNPTLKRKIPEGWEVQPLRRHLNCNTKKLGKKHNYRKVNYLDTANLTSNKLDSVHELTVGVDDIPSRANMIVSKNDILYSTVRPNLLHFGLIRKPVENMIASTGFSVLSSKISSEYNSLFYQHITADWNTKKLIKIAESSKSSYPSISPDDILNLNIALPVARDLIDSAVNILNPVFDKISERQHENQELIALRDWLLPMLMNGQVTIKS